MANKHNKHGKHLNQRNQQTEKAKQDLVQDNLAVILDWYLTRVQHYERKVQQYASQGNERLLESAAGKSMLFRYKAERLVNSL